MKKVYNTVITFCEMKSDKNFAKLSAITILTDKKPEHFPKPS